MSVPTMQGVTARTITTNRITTRVLFSGPEDGIPVLFLHGNLSSGTWWEQTLVALPGGYRGIAPDQRGFGDADLEAKIDASRGVGDLADDAVAPRLCGKSGPCRFVYKNTTVGPGASFGLLYGNPVVQFDQ